MSDSSCQTINSLVEDFGILRYPSLELNPENNLYLIDVALFDRDCRGEKAYLFQLPCVAAERMLERLQELVPLLQDKIDGKYNSSHTTITEEKE